MGGHPTPIKDSMSVILKNDQIWSNYTSDSCGTFGPRGTHGESGPLMASCRGDFRESSGNLDIAAIRNVDTETFDTFTKSLVQRHTKKKRFAARKASSKIGKLIGRTKKSRQVFTCSRPTSYEPPSGRVLNGDIEIYESSGGTVTSRDIEGLPRTHQPSATSTWTTARHEPLPQVPVLPRLVPATSDNARIDPYDSNSSLDTQIFFPERLLTPDQLAGCFPHTTSHPDLGYTVSNQSIPLKQFTSAHDFGDIFKTLNSHLNGSSGLSPMKSLTTYPKEDQYTSEMKNSDIFHGCQELNDFLSKKMTKTLAGTSIFPNRGRFMNYAKFNSSFKITEDFYEDVNRKSVSKVPNVAGSFAGFSFRGPNLTDRNLGYIHRFNPDFDENQSLTEALTSVRSPIQSSSLTSVAMRSDLTAQMYKHFAKSANLKTPEKGKISWMGAPEAETRSEFAFRLNNKRIVNGNEFFTSSAVSQLDQKSEFVDFSNETGSCVSLSRVVSAIRKQHLTELKISLKNTLNHGKKETDLWSSATLSPVRSDLMDLACDEPVSPMKLCDVISQTGVFNNSSVELFKRPFWKFKMSPVWDVRRSKLVQELSSKAHYYMCGKYYHRARLSRCYFRRTPALRLSDQSTQFPDSNPKSGDRLPDIEKRDDGEIFESSDRSLEKAGFNFGCSNAFHCQTFRTNPSDPSTGHGSCHKRVSSMSITEINCICPGKATVYCTGSNTMAGERQSPVHANVAADLQDQTSLLGDLDGPNPKPKMGHISHSFRALCDKRRIRIKYEDGNYTVYKEVDSTRRRTVWSLLTGKATNLLSSVIPSKKPSPKRCFHSQKTKNCRSSWTCTN